MTAVASAVPAASVALVLDGHARHIPGTSVAADLLTVLREQLDCLAPKEGCGTGVCGACTVLLDREPVAACVVLAGDTAGCEVETAARVSARQGADVAQCLTLAGGIQCGFCSPGFVVSITALLERHPAASDSEARWALAGNLCRCTGYGRILAAVRMVQEQRRLAPP